MTIVDGSARQQPTLELVRDLTHQTSTLVHQEIALVRLELMENLELAKAEMTEKGRTAGAGVAALAAAGVAGLLALGAFTAFLILALDGVMPNWAAALCAAAAWVAVAVPLVLYGRNKLRDVGTAVPTRTIEAVKEDVAWLGAQTN